MQIVEVRTLLEWPACLPARLPAEHLAGNSFTTERSMVVQVYSAGIIAALYHLF